MLIVFLFAAVAQLSFWGMFNRYAFPASDRQVPEEESGPFLPVSVIVCFRNEEAQIQNCLVSILKQEYSGDFEIVAVDDNSTDNSAVIVQNLAAEFGSQLRLLQPGPTRPGKKDALTFGISNARHDHILLTDADCRPATNAWLKLMTQPLRAGAELVLGVGEYERQGRQMVNHFQRFEAVYVSIKYLSFARMGLPYMGVGRNLAYRKDFFLQSGGFSDHADLPGGDDDLLVGGHANGRRTVCVTHPFARTVSSMSGSWSVFLRQRMRHQSVGFRYRLVHQVVLALVALSHGLFFLLGFFLLFTSLWWLALLVYAARLLMVLSAYRKAGLLGADAGALEGDKEQGTTNWMIPFFDAMFAPWYLFLAVAGWFPARRW